MLQLILWISHYSIPTTDKTMTKGPEKRFQEILIEEWHEMNLAVNFWLSGFKYVLLQRLLDLN